jgi:ubiquinone/menaquinone biosynthesis C-methylase UbiE
MNNQLHILAEENGKSLFQIAIPRYLEETYWWAYVHPKAVTIFEKQWIVNLILLGNFARLRDAALDELGQEIDGRILQIACVYGDFSVKLAERLTRNSSLDIVDVLPVQLENARRKIPKTASVQILQRDSARLNFPDACYDKTILFFLLHEMPLATREKTLREAYRVLKPGGKLVITEYHQPARLNPLRYLYPLMFKLLEPFALETWNVNFSEWFQKEFDPANIEKETFFGGLYQKMVITKR